ncbi:hypothetical protein IZY60_09295 [Lutibacter sp. B2]|nr:hypothetical protein [Lutibacter sp. B2]
MKNKRFKKLLAVGLLIGIMSVFTISYGETTNLISVWVQNNIKFEFNGVEKNFPDEYKVLTYKGITYVPMNYICQNLDAKLDWEESTNMVRITTERQNEIEKIIEENEKVAKTYEKLPIMKLKDNILINISSISIDSNETSVYLKIENKGKIPVQLIQKECKIISDGKAYAFNKKDNKYNMNWYEDIREDKNIADRIILPKVPNNKDMTLYLKILKNNIDQEIEEVEFNIKAIDSSK